MARTRNPWKPLEKVTIHGATGEGLTKAAAKADAMNKIETAFATDYPGQVQPDYSPRVIVWRGWCVIVWRELDGWYSDMLSPDELAKGVQSYNSQFSGPGKIGKLHSTQANGTDYPTIMRQTLMHLAENAWSVDCDDTSPVVNENDRNAFLGWCRWQRTYRAWKDSGETDDETIREHAWRETMPDGTKAQNVLPA